MESSRHQHMDHRAALGAPEHHDEDGLHRASGTPDTPGTHLGCGNDMLGFWVPSYTWQGSWERQHGIKDPSMIRLGVPIRMP